MVAIAPNNRVQVRLTRSVRHQEVGRRMLIECTYSTSEHSSRRSKSSARYSGARQMAGVFTSRSFCISGGS
jgi:hypothetical protein